jgi:Fe-S cluster biogenesis protein NfuA
VEDFAQITTSGPLFEQVDAALEQLRPALRADGGDVRLVELEDDSIAIVEMMGKCSGCPISEITVRYGIEGHLRSEVPQIIAVDVRSDDPKPGKSFTDLLESARIVEP